MTIPSEGKKQTDKTKLLMKYKYYPNTTNKQIDCFVQRVQTNKLAVPNKYQTNKLTLSFKDNIQCTNKMTVPSKHK